MQEQKIETFLYELFNKKIETEGYEGRKFDVNIINSEGKSIVESMIRKHLLNTRDSKIGNLEAKVYFYEEMIAKSNFAPMIKNEEPNEIDKCNLHDVIVRFSDLDAIVKKMITSNYSKEDLESDDEALQGEITIAETYFKEGMQEVINAL